MFYWEVEWYLFFTFFSFIYSITTILSTTEAACRELTLIDLLFSVAGRRRDLYCDESLEGCPLLVLAGTAQLGATVNSNAGAYEVFDYSTTVINYIMQDLFSKVSMPSLLLYNIYDHCIASFFRAKNLHVKNLYLGSNGVNRSRRPLLLSSLTMEWETSKELNPLSSSAVSLVQQFLMTTFCRGVRLVVPP